MRHRIFISYSHQDAALVTPVVRLLRATRGRVFLDVDTILPGRRWRTELMTALRAATLIVVFWCRHSSQSSEVQTEYRTAVEVDKDVLPVLLDSTPLPHDLEAFQWIDFRELSQERHGNSDLEPRRGEAFALVPAVALAAIAAASIVLETYYTATDPVVFVVGAIIATIVAVDLLCGPAC